MKKSIIFFTLFAINSCILLGQESIDNEHHYNITLAYREAYLDIIRNNELIKSRNDSSLIEISMFTTLGELMLGKNDTIGIKDEYGIKYYVRDSVSKKIEGYISYSGTRKKLWIQNNKAHQIIDTIVFFDWFISQELPKSANTEITKINLVLSRYVGSNRMFPNDQILLTCKKELTIKQLDEIRYYFLDQGEIKEKYIEEYGCNCIPLFRREKPLIIK